MHPVHWTIVSASWEELLAFDCTRDNVAHERVSLGKVCREVHLLPLEPLANAQPREAEVRANRLAFHKVEQTV